MTAQTKVEELAADCIARFNPPKSWKGLSGPEEEAADRAWTAAERYLNEVITGEVALDVVQNFPDKFVDALDFGDVYGSSSHPLEQVVAIAMNCVTTVMKQA